MSVEFRRTSATSGEVAFDAPATPDQVYDYLADFPRHGEWTGELASMEQTSTGPVSVGTTYRTVELMRDGSSMKSTTFSEILALERPRHIEWTARTSAKHGPMAMRSRWSFEIEPRDGGSHVTQRFSIQPLDVSGALFGRVFVAIADGLMGGAGASPKNVTKHAERLQQKLGAIARTSGPSSEAGPQA